MHTHLKGRIFTAEGTSYLVLSEPGKGPETLQVMAVNAGRSVQEMATQEIERHLSAQEPGPATATR